MKADRLDRILAGTGLYSRREAKHLIQSGSVTVDGVSVRAPETRVSRSSVITAAGEKLDSAEYVYYMLNKPAGYVSASKPEGDYPPVTELLPAHLRRRGIFCVGRLDVDVTGLLILTDDGEFAHRATSPRSEIVKTYEVLADGPLRAGDAEILAAGVTLESGVHYRPARLELDEGDIRLCRVSVTEGKYHEVKNLMAVLDRRVVTMRRLSVGGLALDPMLAPGGYRRLEEEEVRRVFL